jgi:uncharacterized membrane protein
MNKLNAFNILFFIAAAVLLGLVFYNYTKTGNVSYTSISIAIMCLFIASIMRKKKDAVFVASSIPARIKGLKK